MAFVQSNYHKYLTMQPGLDKKGVLESNIIIIDDCEICQDELRIRLACLTHNYTVVGKEIQTKHRKWLTMTIYLFLLNSILI